MTTFPWLSRILNARASFGAPWFMLWNHRESLKIYKSLPFATWLQLQTSTHHSHALEHY